METPEQPSSFGCDQNKLRSFLPCLLVLVPGGDQAALKRVGSRRVRPRPPPDPAYLAGDPEAVALSLQPLAGIVAPISWGLRSRLKGTLHVNCLVPGPALRSANLI